MIQNSFLAKIKKSFSAFFLGLLLLTLIDFLVNHYLLFAYEALKYPFGLDYGEGAVLQQLLKIPSPTMYGDINVYPFIIFNYPPVYYFVVRFFALFFPDYLCAGRLVSILATSGIAILVFLFIMYVTQKGVDKFRILASTIAALTVFTFFPVFSWSVLMRVDMLALMLSLLGMYVALRSMGRPMLLYGAAFIFLLGLFTKQTMIAAPLATFGIMLFLRPKLTIRVLICAASIGSAFFFVITYITHGGFLLHVIQYNINLFDWTKGFALLISQFRLQWCYLLIVLISLSLLWHEVLAGISRMREAEDIRQHLLKNRLSFLVVLFTIYFILATGMIFCCGKVGANVNYFLEWVCCWSVLIGLAVVVMLRSLAQAESFWMLTKRAIFCAGVALVLACQVWSLSKVEHGWSQYAQRIPQIESLRLIEMIRQVTKPVISSDPMLILKAGKEVPYEPFTFQELVDVGLWDQQLIVSLIQKRSFAFIITNINQDFDKSFPYSESFENVIMRAYPRAVQGQYYAVRYPKN